MITLQQKSKFTIPAGIPDQIILSVDQELPDNEPIIVTFKETEFGSLSNMEFSLDSGVNWISITDSSVSRKGSRYIINKKHTGLVPFRLRVSTTTSPVKVSNISMLVEKLPTIPSGPSAPSAPQMPQATTISDTQINLVWSAPSSNGGSPITGYQIERRIGTGSFTTLVADTGNTNTNYSDTGLTASTLYTYRVSAINAIGTSISSAEAGATTSGGAQAGPPTTRSVQTISGSTSDSPSLSLREFNNPMADGTTWTTNSGIAYIVPFDCYIDDVTYTITSSPGVGKYNRISLENRGIKETGPNLQRYYASYAEVNETNTTETEKSAVPFKKNDLLLFGNIPFDTPTGAGASSWSFKIVSDEGAQCYFTRTPNDSNALSAEKVFPMVNRTNTAGSFTLTTHDVVAEASGVISNLNIIRDQLLSAGNENAVKITNVTTGLSIQTSFSDTSDRTQNSANVWLGTDTPLTVTSGDTLRLSFIPITGSQSLRFPCMSYKFVPDTPNQVLFSLGGDNSASTEGPITNLTYFGNSANVGTTTARIKIFVKEHRNDYQILVSPNSNMSSPIFTGSVQDSTLIEHEFGANNIIAYIGDDITGLSEDTRYYYALQSNGVVDTSFIGEFVTMATGNKSFRLSSFSCMDTRDLSQPNGDVNYRIESLHRLNQLGLHYIVQLGDFKYQDNIGTVLATHNQGYLESMFHPEIRNMLRKFTVSYTTSDHDCYGPGNSDMNSTNADIDAPVGRQSIDTMFAQWDSAQPNGTGFVKTNAHSFENGRVLNIVLDTQFQRYRTDTAATGNATMIGNGLSMDGFNHTVITWDQKGWLINLLQNPGNAKLVILYLGGSKQNHGSLTPGVGQGYHSVEWIQEWRDIGDAIAESDVEVILTSGDWHMVEYSSGGDGTIPNGGDNRFNTNGIGQFASFVNTPMYDAVLEDTTANGGDGGIWDKNNPTWIYYYGTRSAYSDIDITDTGSREIDYVVTAYEGTTGAIPLNNPLNGSPAHPTGVVSLQVSNRDFNRTIDFGSSTDTVSSGAGTYNLRINKTWLGSAAFHCTSTGTGSTLIDADFETKPNKRWIDIPITLTGPGSTTFTLSAHTTPDANTTVGGIEPTLVLTIT